MANQRAINRISFEKWESIIGEFLALTIFYGISPIVARKKSFRDHDLDEAEFIGV